MASHKFDSKKKTRSQLAQRAKCHNSQTRIIHSEQFDHRSSGNLQSGIFGNSSATVHASLLNRTLSPQASTLLQLQHRYGNRHVQRVVALARNGDGRAEVSPEIEQAIQRKRGGGRALDNKARAQMESAMGADFDRVRVHTDGAADVLNRELSARAFTTGTDIFFRNGEYQPGSSRGRELLAHELTHVVQQTGGMRRKMRIGHPGDSYEQEADRVARAIVQQEKQVTSRQENMGSVQRQLNKEEEDQTVQSKIEDRLIQRQIDDEEDELQIKPLRRNKWLAPGLSPIVQQRQGTIDSEYGNKASGFTEPTLSSAETVHRLSEMPSQSRGTILQRQSSEVGNLFLRLNENGRVEIIYGTPKVSGLGPFGVGARCQNGRCQLIGSGDPADMKRTYTVDEVKKVLRKYGRRKSAMPLCPPNRSMSAFGCCPVGTIWDGSRCANIPLPLEQLKLPGQKRKLPEQLRTPRITPPGAFQLQVTPMVARLIGSAEFDNFSFGKASVPKQHRKRITELSETIKMLLKSYPLGHVTVTGHTDAVGSLERNEQLGQQRADAVKTALVSAGVDSNFITTLSAGKTKLLIQTKKREPRNRRVRVQFQPKPLIRLQIPPLKLTP